ncbi:MAG: type IX secretion system membrane protein PorP/SprF [Chitinophagales bacterium]|nr:type IX secretion system membrane protein PorP/SprF [Chitinophagales bacterium]
MKYLLTTILVLCGVCFAPIKAQDLHYSQHVYNSLYYNPALTGFFEGCVRLNGSYADRYRQAYGKDGMRTAFGAVDFNIPINSAYSDKSSVGVGAYFYNNKAGYNSIADNVASVMVAYRITLDEEKRHTLSAGLSAVYQSRKYGYADLQFGNQFDGFNYNPNINSGELFDIESSSKFDANIGLLYSFKANDNFKGFIGTSINHLLPEKDNDYLSFSDGIRYNVHGGLDIGIGSVSLKPLVMFDKQMKASEIYTGVEFGYDITHEKDNQLALFAGPYLRMYKSPVGEFSMYTANIVAGVRYNALTLLVATDNTINDSKKTFSGFNGFEVGLTYTVACSDKKGHKIYCPVF